MSDGLHDGRVQLADAPRSCSCGYPANGRKLHSGGAECTAWVGMRAVIEGAKEQRAVEEGIAPRPAIEVVSRREIGEHLLTAHERTAYDAIVDLREAIRDDQQAIAGDVAGTKSLTAILVELLPDELVTRVLARLERDAGDASFNGRNTARVLERAVSSLAAASLEHRRLRGPRSDAERAIGGHPLELGRDGGGARHFVDGRPVSCGATLEVNRGGIWTRVRYEAQLYGDPAELGGKVWLCDEAGDHELQLGDRFRWPSAR